MRSTPSDPASAHRNPRAPRALGRCSYIRIYFTGRHPAHVHKSESRRTVWRCVRVACPPANGHPAHRVVCSHPSRIGPSAPGQGQSAPRRRHRRKHPRDRVDRVHLPAADDLPHSWRGERSVRGWGSGRRPGNARRRRAVRRRPRRPVPSGSVSDSQPVRNAEPDPVAAVRARQHHRAAQPDGRGSTDLAHDAHADRRTAVVAHSDTVADTPAHGSANTVADANVDPRATAAHADADPGPDAHPLAHRTAADRHAIADRVTRTVALVGANASADRRSQRPGNSLTLAYGLWGLWEV